MGAEDAMNAANGKSDAEVDQAKTTHPGDHCTLKIAAPTTKIDCGKQTTITTSGGSGALTWEKTGQSTGSPSGQDYNLTGAASPEVVTLKVTDGNNCSDSVTIYVGKLTLSSETTATSPSNRARTKIGVGEQVTINATMQSTWSVSGGNGILDNGSTNKSDANDSVIYTAGDQAGNVTITATAGPYTQTITFSVVTPTHWSMKLKTDNTALVHKQGTPGCGWYGWPYIHPNDVNFYNVQIRECDSQATYSGSISENPTPWHGNYPKQPDGKQASGWSCPDIKTHDENNGSCGFWPDGDHIYRSWISPTSAYQAGTISYAILWQWNVINQKGINNFPMGEQVSVFGTDGSCTTRKGIQQTTFAQATEPVHAETCKVTDATNMPPWA